MTSANDYQPFVFTPAVVTAAVKDAALEPPAGGRTSPISTAAANADPLVQVTVREIADIVREVAAAVRSDRSAEDFFGFFVDRVLRAMAAEGVIVWRLSDAESAERFQAVRSVGRVTEAAIPIEGIRAHQRLLSEVSIQGQPVVVPATPGATDDSVPANPLDVPAAVLAIQSDPTAAESEYLLEIFLDPESGVATQRGYLRFAAQMVDLAGEFMRADQLRQLRRSRKIVARVDQTLACLHEQTSTVGLEAQIVDLAADVFQLDQVGLCYFDGSHTDLAAVSHVDQIDRRSAAAKRLITNAKLELGDGGIARIDLGQQDDGLDRGIVVGRDASSIRLIGLTKSDAPPWDDETAQQLQRFLLHAELALSQTARFESIPGGRLLASLAPVCRGHRTSRWTRPIVTAAVLTLLLVAACFPLPLIVTAAATVKAADAQTINLPRDAIVQQVHVDHGHIVGPGDPLVTLVDPQLEREIVELMGRRAVLGQQQSRWTNALVETPSSRMEQNEQLEGQRSLVMEEISSVDQQLDLLRQIKASLTIRADRSGIVEGWRIQERLSGRPLRRGDHLLAVVAEDSRWIVDARISQNRLSHVRDAMANKLLLANVILDTAPDQHWQASLSKIGPSFSASQDAVTTTAALLELDREKFRPELNSGQFNAISGSPARVVFDCGSAPLAYLLFQDLFRKAGGSIGLYFGSGNESPGVE